jgi:hypothetical protein
MNPPGSAEIRACTGSTLWHVPTETFKRNWRGWTRSSDGYAVRLLGRTNLQYVDEYGELRLSAEAMSRPWSKIVVDTSSIPDRAGRPRAEVVSRLRRVFDHKGWSLVERDT